MIRKVSTDVLASHQRAAVSAAGALGLALVSAGASIVWGLLVAALFVALLRAAFIDVFSHVTWGGGALEWIEQLNPGWLVPIVLTLVLVAVAVIALGCVVSTRRMRAADVTGATAVTFRGAAIGTGLQAVLSVLTSWLLGLLTLLTSALGFWIVAGIWLVLSISMSALIGWLAGPRTWLAIARREARRGAAAEHKLEAPALAPAAENEEPRA